MTLTFFQPPPERTPWQHLTASDKTEAVRELVQIQHKSYGEAAKILGCTRTSVAGVVDRSRTQLGGKIIVEVARALEHRRKAAAANRPPGKAKKAEPKKPRPRITTPAVYPEGPPTDPVPLIAEAWAALPGSHPVPIAEHSTGCRWPVFGPDGQTLFCNEDPEPNNRYCAHHVKLGTRELPKKETTQ